MQHMIGSVILSASLNAQHIPRLGYNTNDRVIPSLAGADSADLILRKILAYTAEMHRMLRPCDGIGKSVRLLIRQGEHVKGQPLRALFPYTGQRGKFINQVFK